MLTDTHFFCFPTGLWPCCIARDGDMAAFWLHGRSSGVASAWSSPVFIAFRVNSSPNLCVRYLIQPAETKNVSWLTETRWLHCR